MNFNDAIQAQNLYEELHNLKQKQGAFDKENEFILSCRHSFGAFPVNPDLAKASANSFFSREIIRVQKELQDLGFTSDE